MCLNCVFAGKTFKIYKKKHNVYMVRKNFKPCQKLDCVNDFNDCLYAEKKVTFLTVYKLKGKFAKKHICPSPKFRTVYYAAATDHSLGLCPPQRKFGTVLCLRETLKNINFRLT